VATRIESRRFEQTKLETANAMLAVAADARKAYVNAVAAEQAAQYAAQVKDSAEAGAELALRMRQAGNFSKLDYAREQAFYAESVAQLAKARQQSVMAREKLTRTMGLWGSGTQYKLPDRLPDLPKDRPQQNDLESFAMQNRLDIQAAKLRTQSVATSLGLSKATRFINALDVGYLDNFETDKGHEHGYEISVEIPIFDWGSAKVARAEAIYMQSANRLAQTAIDARSEVRESYSAYVTSYDVAKHYRDEVVPVRKTISDEMLLRYNGMLASVFELLADSRDQVAAVNGYIDALKDYWLAETDLQQSLGGRLPPLAMAPAPGAPQSDATPTPPAPVQDSPLTAPATLPASPTNSEGK
jgi:outer membrane protein TolC